MHGDTQVVGEGTDVSEYLVLLDTEVIDVNNAVGEDISDVRHVGNEDDDVNDVVCEDYCDDGAYGGAGHVTASVCEDLGVDYDISDGMACSGKFDVTGVYRCRETFDGKVFGVNHHFGEERSGMSDLFDAKNAVFAKDSCENIDRNCKQTRTLIDGKEKRKAEQDLNVDSVNINSFGESVHHKTVRSHVDRKGLQKDFIRNEKISNSSKDNDGKPASHILETFDLVRHDKDKRSSVSNTVGLNVSKKTSNTSIFKASKDVNPNIEVEKVLRKVIDDSGGSSHVERFQRPGLDTDIGYRHRDKNKAMEVTDKETHNICGYDQDRPVFSNSSDCIAKNVYTEVSSKINKVNDRMHNVDLQVQNRIRNVSDQETAKDNEENNSLIGNNMSDSPTDYQRQRIHKFYSKNTDDKHVCSHSYNRNNYEMPHDANNFGKSKRSVSDRLKVLQNINYREVNKVQITPTNTDRKDSTQYTLHSDRNAKDSVVNSFNYASGSNITNDSFNLNSTCDKNIPKITEDRISFWKKYYKFKHIKRNISGSKVNSNAYDMNSSNLQVLEPNIIGYSNYTKADKIRDISNLRYNTDKLMGAEKKPLHSNNSKDIRNKNTDTKVSEQIDSKEFKTKSDLNIIDPNISNDTTNSINFITSKIGKLHLGNKIIGNAANKLESDDSIMKNNSLEIDREIKINNQGSSGIQNKRLLKIMNAFKSDLDPK